MTDPIDDISNYKWAVFYFNRNDYRIVVPKRARLLGWTLNFAWVESWLIIAGLLLLSFVATLFL